MNYIARGDFLHLTNDVEQFAWIFLKVFPCVFDMLYLCYSLGTFAKNTPQKPNLFLQNNLLLQVFFKLKPLH